MIGIYFKGNDTFLKFISVGQMRGEFAICFNTELLLCVLIDSAPSNIHNFLIFNPFLLKLSLTCFSSLSASIKSNLISGWTSPLKGLSWSY